MTGCLTPFDLLLLLRVSVDMCIISCMRPDDYQTTWDAIVERRQELMSKRADLEADLDDINTEITHLDQILSHLTPLTGQHDVIFSSGDITGLGITEAIRTVLVEKCPNRVSANEVFQILKDKGFNFTKYSHPMASVYKVLSRLKDAEEVDVENENRNVFYKWRIKEGDIPYIPS